MSSPRQKLMKFIFKWHKAYKKRKAKMYKDQSSKKLVEKAKFEIEYEDSIKNFNLKQYLYEK